MWTHVPLGWPVPKELDNWDCCCARTGRLQSFIFARGAKADYLAFMEAKLGVDAIAKATSQNDIVANSVLQVLENRVGQATAMLINMLEPEIITLAIHPTNPNRLYVNVPRKWPGYIHSLKSKKRIVSALREAIPLV